MPTSYDANLTVFKINDGTLRDISDNIVSITPSFSRTMNPVTTYGNTHEQVAPGLLITSFAIELIYNEDASTGTDTVLGALLEDTTVRAYEYYPRGTGGKKYDGNCYVENYQPISRVGNAVTATCTLRCVSRTRT
jgi:hypothetical protein